MNHSEALEIFLGVFVAMPLSLFFGLRWMARRWLSTRPTWEADVEIENRKRLLRMSPSTRTYVAVAICLSSAIWGAIAIRRGTDSISNIAFNVAFPWFLSGSWLAGDFTREGLKRLNTPLSKIFHDARQRKLAKAPPLARVMHGGGGIMLLAGIAAWFL